MAVSRPENRFETSNEHTISTYGISKKIDQKGKSVDTNYESREMLGVTFKLG
jgi:hypothetical protein